MAVKTAKKPVKKGPTGRLVKSAKPAAKAKAKPATAKTTKPATNRVAKSSGSRIVKAPSFRGARHDKPGTGRLDRSPAADRAPTSRRASTAAAAATAPTSTAIKFGPSPFPRDELKAWRQTLLGHRSEISQDIQHLEHDAMEAEDGHTTPNHIAERGSDAEMQDMSLGLAGQEQIVLWQIDRALRKIDSGIPSPFGLCEHNGQPIPKTRLQLIPWTPVSIEGMNYVEDNGLTIEDILVDG
ncbi:MAG: hypothetical protein AAB263_21600 [Planctomycetota bacterium]